MKLSENYMRNLVNMFFKILPMWEDNVESLPFYIEELRDELIGSSYLIGGAEYDHRIMSLASILQFLADHPETEVSSVRRKVFHAIDLCKQLSAEYAEVSI